MHTIEAADDAGIISTYSTGPITLGVGKGGKGAQFNMAIRRCAGGWITFAATFFGVDEDGDGCWGTRSLRKQCK